MENVSVGAKFRSTYQAGVRRERSEPSNSILSHNGAGRNGYCRGYIPSDEGLLVKRCINNERQTLKKKEVKLWWCHSFVHFLEAPLGVRSAKRRHQSPEWTFLSHVNCFIQGEVIGFRVLPDSLHPRTTRAFSWSPPVLQGRICDDREGKCA